MLVLGAVVSWIGTKGLALVLGYLVKFGIDLFNEAQKNAALRDAGRLEAERRESVEGSEAQDEMAKIAAKETGESELLDKLRKGAA